MIQGKTLTPEAEFLARVCLTRDMREHRISGPWRIVGHRLASACIQRKALHHDLSTLQSRLFGREYEAVAKLLRWLLSFCQIMRNDCNNFWMIPKVETESASGMRQLAGAISLTVSRESRVHARPSDDAEFRFDSTLASHGRCQAGAAPWRADRSCSMDSQQP